MKSAAVEQKTDSSSSSSGSYGKDGFDELVRATHDIDNNEIDLKGSNIASQEYIQKLVSESLKTNFVSSPFDKVADDSGLHYTSSFKVRPQAEYFDFDEKYMYKPERKNEGDGDMGTEDANENEDGDEDEDSTEDGLQSVIDACSLCKTVFGDMIRKIDKVALTSMSYKTTKMGHTHLDKEISDILDTVKDLGPSSENEPSTSAQQLQQGEIARVTSTLTLEETSNVVQGPYDNLLKSDPCARLPNFGVILIKSPASVSQLWDEYTKIPAEWPVRDLFTFTLLQQGGPNNISHIELITKRRTSIKQLESSLGSSWRNADKNFSRQINRRKKIWKTIEEGLSDGLSLDTCFSILENYVKNRGKGLSWYYNGVPFKLLDIFDKIPADKKR